MYAEVQRLGTELARLAPHLNQQPQHAVALIDRWCDRSALRFQRHHRDWSPEDHASAWYGALQRLGVGCDVLEDVGDLSRYRVVIAPSLHLIDDALAARLTAFVAGGGQLILGQRSGMKDAENRLHAQRAPGALATLAGCRVRDFHALRAPVALTGDLGEGSAALYGEDLDLDGAEAWARYRADAGWLAGNPAVAHRAHGAGGCTYAGCWGDAAFLGRLLTRVLASAGVPTLRVPAGVDLARRGALVIAVNSSDAAAEIDLECEHDDLLGGGRVRRLHLAPAGVAVLRADA